MQENIIVHISEADISLNSGMGRIEYYWRESFEKHGFTFMHIGPKETGKLMHRGLFPYYAYKYYKKLKLRPKAFIIHEPASGYFVKKGIPAFVESHGIERRHWEGQLNGLIPSNSKSLKTKLLFPLWRLRACDKGLKNSNKLLISNSDDKSYVKKTYKRNDEDILIFKNGVNLSTLTLPSQYTPFTILFNASWVERKGIYTLIEAAKILAAKNLSIKYLLTGTLKDVSTVLNDWPEMLKTSVTVIPHFEQKEESAFLASASVFVLPSYFEGQPLSLLQAMAAGVCCITTDCCGQKDIIQNTETGFLFDVGNGPQLAVLIEKCYNNKELVDKIGSNGKRHIQSLTWDIASKEVVDFVLINT